MPRPQAPATPPPPLILSNSRTRRCSAAVELLLPSRRRRAPTPESPPPDCSLDLQPHAAGGVLGSKPNPFAVLSCRRIPCSASARAANRVFLPCSVPRETC